ncbi:AAA-domain-containing protein [Coniophora puteana RWD-64-598 SS2]|uniref:Peroxisomal ATPase PEX1 n=1 Tax=Coniophora puteana (strain RWD-64-598) TaxID=741705 RepID=A0A5M3M640_CONPW|nr:AAA-domain-containing protein [Coniophora puteana RWD-64-598 SS2]EIW74842.1 AAA-domain-containing protein [Coniophora puteana RWD-64-598 SS2]
MPRRARVHYAPIKSSLVNLPISIYGPLLERNVRPQSLAIHLSPSPSPASKSQSQSQSKNPNGVYVGWTGMPSASSLAHFQSQAAASGDDRGLETIELDPQYAVALGFAQDDVVEVGLIHDLSPAKRVGTVPVGVDDWEIIEIHAAHLETALLSQVRVASVGQEVDVWVQGRTRVRLRVESIDPPPPSRSPAALLSTDTEVSVAPLSRNAAKKPKPKAVSQPDGKGDENKSKGKEDTAKKHPPQILRILPLRLIPALGSPTTPEASASTGPRIPQPLHPTIPSTPSAPIDAYISPHTLADLLACDYPPPREKATRKEAKDRGALEEGVWVAATHDVIPSHVVFLGPLEGEMEEWDLLQCVYASYIHFVIHFSSSFCSATATGDRHGLIGVDEQLRDCFETAMACLALGASTSKRMRGVPGMLITGRAGTGKTSFANAVARAVQEDGRTLAYVHKIDLEAYASKPVKALKELFHYAYAKVAWHRPAVLVFENVDKVMGAEKENEDSFRTRNITELFVAQFSSTARQFAPDTRGIVMLATAQSHAGVHPLLSTKHLWRGVWALMPPGRDARKAVSLFSSLPFPPPSLGHLIEKRLKHAPSLRQDEQDPPNVSLVASATEGFAPADLDDLVGRAVHQAAMRAVAVRAEVAGDVVNGQTPGTALSAADFVSAQKDFVPLSLRDVPLQKSDVEWADVGGLGKTKRVLRETIEWPTKYAVVFRQSPLRLRSGIMLYGYPGCGKTMLASAVAKECGLNFISVKGPELLNKYIGASEQSVRDIFERATSAKPCVLFFDEFDSIAPKRGHDSTGVTDRVVNQMLTQMDGAEGLEGVYVLAATSRPDLIDPALLRPGRLDKSLLCDMPDESDRKEASPSLLSLILEAVSRKVATDASVDLGEIAAQTEGYSGADLQALVYNAHLAVVHAAIAEQPKVSRSAGAGDKPALKFVKMGGKDGGSAGVKMSKADERVIQDRLERIRAASRGEQMGKKVAVASGAAARQHEVSQAHLLEALKTTRPSVAFEEQARLRRIYQEFTSERGGKLPAPPTEQGVGSRSSLM